MTNSSKRLLCVVTSHHKLGDTALRTGFHYEELTTPYYYAKNRGIEVDIASIRGGKPVHDPQSFAHTPEERPASVNRFIEDAQAIQKLTNTLAIATIEIPYDAIYLVGGHGAMWDFPENKPLARLVSKIYAEGGIIAAICHGTAGLLAAVTPEGRPLVEGKRLTCFTDREEKLSQKEQIVPFLLESRLRATGALFECAPPSKACVVKDKQCISGQNPASIQGVAEAIVKALHEVYAI